MLGYGLENGPKLAGLLLDNAAAGRLLHHLHVDP